MEDNIKPGWRTSSYTGNGGGNCVEVGDAARVILVRDTKDRAGPMLRFSPDSWRQFADQVKRSLAGPEPSVQGVLSRLEVAPSAYPGLFPRGGSRGAVCTRAARSATPWALSTVLCGRFYLLFSSVICTASPIASFAPSSVISRVSSPVSAFPDWSPLLPAPALAEQSRTCSRPRPLSL